METSKKMPSLGKGGSTGGKKKKGFVGGLKKTIKALTGTGESAKEATENLIQRLPYLLMFFFYEHLQDAFLGIVAIIHFLADEIVEIIPYIKEILEDIIDFMEYALDIFEMYWQIPVVLITLIPFYFLVFFLIKQLNNLFP